jgi:hypothetical protein
VFGFVTELTIIVKAVVNRAERSLENTEQFYQIIPPPECLPYRKYEGKDHGDTEQRDVKVIAEIKFEAQPGDYKAEKQDKQGLVINYRKILLHKRIPTPYHYLEACRPAIGIILFKILINYGINVKHYFGPRSLPAAFL